ncbi:MAG: sugar transferase [Actinobacteria bacterium]|nr:sugar transferase [Actinomycetota bacterium]
MNRTESSAEGPQGKAPSKRAVARGNGAGEHRWTVRGERPDVTIGVKGGAGGTGRRGLLVRRMLMLADLAGLGLAFALAIVIFRNRIGPNPVGWEHELALFVATLPAWVLIARLHGLYDRDEERASHSTLDDLVGVFHLVTVGTFLVFAGSWLTGLANPYPPKLLTFWVLAIALVALARVCARSFARTRRAYVQNAVIVGVDSVGKLIARKILDHPEYGVNIVGFVDSASDRRTEVIGGLPVLGPPEELPEIVRAHDVERVVIAFFDRPVEEAIDLVSSAKDLRVQIDIVPRLFAAVDPRAQIHTLEGFPLIGLSPPRLWRSSLFLKRSLDVVLAGLGLVLLAPAFAWIAIRIRLESPGPVFYKHERVGMNGKLFNLIKFRTMYLEHCIGEGYGGDAATGELQRLLEDPAAREEFEYTHKLEDDPRVTRFGQFLRRTSLDELPQLLNVLRGDMSLVGPRPVTEAELTRYHEEVGTLLSFRPGVTGYWQINGRSRSVYEERVRLDIAYVRGWSFKLDLAVLGKTAWTLVKGHGAY